VTSRRVVLAAVLLLTVVLSVPATAAGQDTESDHLTVEPNTALADLQVVTVAGSGFGPGKEVGLQYCGVEVCTPLRTEPALTTDDGGSFRVEVELSRRIGTHDCAVEACSVRTFPSLVAQRVHFDDASPPPAGASLVVTPGDGLGDEQGVTLAVEGLRSGPSYQIGLCESTDGRCRHLWSGLADSPAFERTVAVPRTVGGVDCAAAGCELVVRTTAEEVRTPVGFDADAGPAPVLTVTVDRPVSLRHGDDISVGVEGLAPGRTVVVAQCVGPELSPDGCTAGMQLDGGTAGTIDVTIPAERQIVVADPPVDCATSTANCWLVVGESGFETGGHVWPAPHAAVELDFDPEGGLPTGPPLAPLPAQAPCVPWPTRGWPAASIPAGVNAAAVQRVGTDMVARGADSVVVIHGGRLVHEAYAEGVTADTVQPSWSISKTIAAMAVGLLVDRDELDLDARAPVPEWADPDDPRHAITLRHLLTMQSGLDWRENYYDAESSDVIPLIQAADASAYVLARPLRDEPGTGNAYSTGDTQVLGHVVARTAGVSGASYRAFLHERLFDPLGMTPIEPGFDAAGNWQAGWATNTTTRSFAKAGLLLLRAGTWEDETLLSPEWVDVMRTPAWNAPLYGGQLWLGGDTTFQMVGFLGQEVHVDPRLDLIVAVNGYEDRDLSEMADLFRDVEPVSCEGAPTPVDDTATVEAGAVVTVDVLANDEAGELGIDRTSVAVSHEPQLGEATVDAATAAITYTAGSAGGDDVVQYRVCAVGAPDRCGWADLRITVTGGETVVSPPGGGAGTGNAAGPGADAGTGTPARPASAVSPPGPGRRSGTMARTGGDVLVLVALGGGAVLAGSAAVVATRRRRTAG
jgi:CubicO group peptidase (beta-lactamase class C family)